MKYMFTCNHTKALNRVWQYWHRWRKCTHTHTQIYIYTQNQISISFHRKVPWKYGCHDNTTHGNWHMEPSLDILFGNWLSNVSTELLDDLGQWANLFEEKWYSIIIPVFPRCSCCWCRSKNDLHFNEWTDLNYRGSSARMIPLQLPLHIYLQCIPDNYAGYGFWCSVMLFCCSHLIMKLTHVLQGCYTGKLPLARLPDCKEINHGNYG